MSKKSLPHGWCHSKLGTLLVFNYGKALPDRVRSGSGFPVYGSNGIVGFHSEPLINGPAIIIGRKGSVGEINWSSEACAPIDTTYYVDEFPGNIPRYWFYQLKTLNLGNLNKATAIPGLNREDAYNQDIMLAPVNEQKRIADKLDAVLARVDACRDRLDRIPAILKRFRQSVLSYAVSGRLTEDWREENPSDIEWKRVRLDQVGNARLGKMLDKNKNMGEDTPYLRNINVRWFNFDLSDIQMIRVTQDEKEKLAIKPGDVLICEGGEPGRCAIWKESDSAFVYQKALHRVRLDQSCSPEWLCYTLKHAADSEQLASHFTGTTIKHFTGIALNNWEFDLPTREEQTEIVRRVESLFAYADRLEARYNAARAQIEKLTPSLLAKAFRGELVPQDPNDEPASELLARIDAAQSEAKPKRRAGRGNNN